MVRYYVLIVCLRVLMLVAPLTMRAVRVCRHLLSVRWVMWVLKLLVLTLCFMVCVWCSLSGVAMMSMLLVRGSRLLMWLSSGILMIASVGLAVV